IDTNFSYIAANMQPNKLGPISSAYMLPLTDPTYTLSAVNHDKLFARIAMLENKVRELKNTNSEIIQTVREKARNKIVSMEELISQTGLNPDTLKEQAARERKQHQKEAGARTFPSEGGPFIPAETGNPQLDNFSQDLQLKMDEMALLTDILHNMPLGKPL